jgi:hypothetical protein
MRRLVPIVLCFALACGSDSAPTQPITASLVGTWVLQNINGQVLPAIVAQTATSKTEMLSDIVTATAAGRYTVVAQLRTTVSGQVTLSSESDAGTYTVTGNAVVIHSDDGSMINGTIVGDTFSVASSGVAYWFKKQ